MRQHRLRGWRHVVQRQMDSYRFTPAQQRVGWTLFTAHTNVDVALALGVSRETVRNHVTEMLHKTNTKSRLELVLVLLSLDDEQG